MEDNQFDLVPKSKVARTNCTTSNSPRPNLIPLCNRNNGEEDKEDKQIEVRVRWKSKKSAMRTDDSIKIWNYETFDDLARKYADNYDLPFEDYRFTFKFEGKEYEPGMKLALKKVRPLPHRQITPVEHTDAEYSVASVMDPLSTCPQKLFQVVE